MNLKKYFVFDTKDGNYEEQKTKKIFRTLYKGVKIPWFRIIIGAFLSVFNVLIIMSQYDNYMKMYEGRLNDLGPLWGYMTAIFAQYIVIFLCVIGDRALVEVVTGVAKKLWRKMVKMPVRDFETSAPGSMLSRITMDTQYASRPFQAVVAILSGFVAIMTLSAVLPDNVGFAVPYLIVSLILAVVLAFYSSSVLAKSTMYVQNKKAEQTDHYNEVLANIRFIKASNAEEETIARSDEFIEKRYNAALMTAFYQGLQELCNTYINLVLAGAFVCVIIAIATGSVKDMAPVNSLYSYLFALSNIAGLMTLPTYFFEAIGGTKKIASIFKGREEDTDSGKAIDTVSGDITLKDVSFAYLQNDAVKDLNVVIPQNQVTAVVGNNGSGKSTMIKLVSRLYPGKKGEICIGDQKASETSLHSWRENFAVVSQKASLFSGSLRENIAYGIEGVSDDVIIKAAEAAGLKELVEQKGLDFEVGTAGSKLSGGEAQRVTIARALVKDPKILILDEATANLDARTRQAVSEGINELMKGRTVIMIAHDYAAIEKADNVIVMRDGRIEDYGKREEMIERNPFMKLMVGN